MCRMLISLSFCPCLLKNSTSSKCRIFCFFFYFIEGSFLPWWIMLWNHSIDKKYYCVGKWTLWECSVIATHIPCAWAWLVVDEWTSNLSSRTDISSLSKMLRMHLKWVLVEAMLSKSCSTFEASSMISLPCIETS